MARNSSAVIKGQFAAKYKDSIVWAAGNKVPCTMCATHRIPCAREGGGEGEEEEEIGSRNIPKYK